MIPAKSYIDEIPPEIKYRICEQFDAQYDKASLYSVAALSHEWYQASMSCIGSDYRYNLQYYEPGTGDVTFDFDFFEKHICPYLRAFTINLTSDNTPQILSRLSKRQYPWLTKLTIKFIMIRPSFLRDILQQNPQIRELVLDIKDEDGETQSTGFEEYICTEFIDYQQKKITTEEAGGAESPPLPTSGLEKLTISSQCLKAPIEMIIRSFPHLRVLNATCVKWPTEIAPLLNNNNNNKSHTLEEDMLQDIILNQGDSITLDLNNNTNNKENKNNTIPDFSSQTQQFRNLSTLELECFEVGTNRARSNTGSIISISMINKLFPCLKKLTIKARVEGVSLDDIIIIPQQHHLAYNQVFQPSAYFAHLTSLSIPLLTAQISTVLCKSCPHLQYLDIYHPSKYDPRIFARDFRALSVSGLPKLKGLRFKMFLPHFTDTFDWLFTQSGHHPQNSTTIRRSITPTMNTSSQSPNPRSLLLLSSSLSSSLNIFKTKWTSSLQTLNMEYCRFSPRIFFALEQFSQLTFLGITLALEGYHNNSDIDDGLKLASEKCRLVGLAVLKIQFSRSGNISFDQISKLFRVVPNLKACETFIQNWETMRKVLKTYPGIRFHQISNC